MLPGAKRNRLHYRYYMYLQDVLGDGTKEGTCLPVSWRPGEAVRNGLDGAGVWCI